MGIGLFTSRVILDSLGVEDYGIYNIVGGFVTMFTVVSGSLSNAISRFITIEIGKGNNINITRVFSTSINIQLFIALLLLLLGEIFGLWFISRHLSIPSDRLTAAMYAFQFSLLSFAINLISVPYNAAIIAYEKMNAFAYISIVEVVLKLTIAYLIYVAEFDRLIFYSSLMLFVTLIIRWIYVIYCSKNFKYCRYKFRIDRNLTKEIGAFAGWGMMGTTAYIFNTQGVNILINMYFGVVMNAARGVSVQIDAAIKQFVNSFTTAINPQITKSYAISNFEYMHNLIFKSAKFSTYLMLFFSVPLILECEQIMDIWLKNPPRQANILLRLTLLCTFIDNILANPLITAQLATGKMKRYQITVTLVGFLVFPLTWFGYMMGAKIYITYVFYSLIYIILLFVRLHLLNIYIYIKTIDYVKFVIKPIFPVLFLNFAFTIPCIFIMEESIYRLVFICVYSTIINSILIFCIGLSDNERQFVKGLIKKYIYTKWLN